VLRFAQLPDLQIAGLKCPSLARTGQAAIRTP